MTGVLKHQGSHMSDRDDCNGNSGGIIGAIISIFILAAIWPYLLAILGIYIAYLVVLAILEWIAHNPLLVVLILLGVFSIYAIFRYRLISKAWKWMVAQLKPRAVEVDLYQNEMASEALDLVRRKFAPSTNLYCYWCTKKLGIKAFELNGKYYCQSCNEKLLTNSMDRS